MYMMTTAPEPYRDLTIFGEADGKTVEQMFNCLDMQPGVKWCPR